MTPISGSTSNRRDLRSSSDDAPQGFPPQWPVRACAPRQWQVSYQIRLLFAYGLVRKCALDSGSIPNRVVGGLEQFQCRCIVDSGETLRQTGNGEIVWGRSAAQAAAGPRPWGRNTRATGGALLGERAVGMEDLRPA